MSCYLLCFQINITFVSRKNYIQFPFGFGLQMLFSDYLQMLFSDNKECTFARSSTTTRFLSI
jgi:hypothetical protein